MDQYTCQFCNKTVTYGEIHSCFFYNYYHNVHSLSQLDDRRDQDAKNDKARYGHTGYSSVNYEKIYPVFQEMNPEDSKTMNYPPPDNNEKVSYKPDLKRKRKRSLFPEETTVDAKYVNPQAVLDFFSTLNVQTNEVHSSENATLKTSAGNFEPGYKSDSQSSLHYKRKPSAHRDSYDENKFEPKLSTSTQTAITEEWEMFDATEFLPLSNDINQFIRSSETAKKTSLVSKNVPEISTVHFSPAFSSGCKETDKDLFEESVDAVYSSIAPEVSSRMFGRSEGMAVNLNQTLESSQAESDVAGPSGIRTDLLRDEKRQIVCDICFRKFDRKSTFERHYRTHTGEKPFVCDRCGKAFAQENNLKVHYRTHTGEKPYMCDICKKCFTDRSAFTRHTRNHAGEKPYKCSVCRMAFSRTDHRNRHYRLKHE